MMKAVFFAILLYSVIGCAGQRSDSADAPSNQSHSPSQLTPVTAGEFERALDALGRKDYETAHKLFKDLADRGDERAQHNLGSMYHQGVGVPVDYAEALKWYRESATKGYAAALNDLGVMYLDGKGVMKDYIEAYKWFSLSFVLATDEQLQKTALENQWSAQFMGRMTKADIAKARQLGEWWIDNEYAPGSP